MDYESDRYECDIWQNVAVITDKESGLCGSVCLKHNGRLATARLIASDVKKHGPDKALSVYAKLVDNWV